MNENKFDLEKFNKLKEQIKLEYEKIGSIYCPALKSRVVFNSEGFHHLRYDGSFSERSKKVQQNKFIYFNKVVDILKITTIVQEYRRSICPTGRRDKNGLRKINIVEWFGFYSIISFSKCI